MQTNRPSLLRRVLPKGGVRNRLAIGGGIGFTLMVFGVCVVAPSYFANVVVNDTQFDAWCRSSVGKPERVTILSGQSAKVDTYDCALYERRGGPYIGCLHQEGFRKRVLVSGFTPDTPEADCDVGIYPPRP